MEINPVFEALISQLAEKGFGFVDNFVSETEIKQLRQSLNSRYANNSFKKAGISKNKKVIQEIRGDEIYWLDQSSSLEAELMYMKLVGDFIAYLNYTCFLGLKTFELHYALYPKNSFYLKHLDVFTTDSKRKLSVILYLNKNWKEEYGGQLKLHLASGDLEILPSAGRLVIMESDKILHEVLPTTMKRKSITGWLKN